jgi:hypothetical protein
MHDCWPCVFSGGAAEKLAELVLPTVAERHWLGAGGWRSSVAYEYEDQWSLDRPGCLCYQKMVSSTKLERVADSLQNLERWKQVSKQETHVSKKKKKSEDSATRDLDYHHNGAKR